jgi:hypothetical protein
LGLPLLLALTLLSGGCAGRVRHLGRETLYLDKQTVVDRIEIQESLAGNSLRVQLQARGERPYEVKETTEQKHACGFTTGSLRGISDNPVMFLMLPAALPMALVLDTATLCQGAPARKTTEVVERNVARDALLPADLIGEVTGRLKITDVAGGKVFDDRIAQYAPKNGVFEIPLPLLNNGGHLRVEFEGDVAVGSKRFPLIIDRKVTI